MTGERTVQAKFVFRMRETVSQIVNESEASSKFDRQDAPNVDMIPISKLDPKEMLEHVVFEQVPKDGQRPAVKMTAEPDEQASLEPE
jgi:hypothetical protein